MIAGKRRRAVAADFRIALAMGHAEEVLMRVLLPRPQCSQAFLPEALAGCVARYQSYSVASIEFSVAGGICATTSKASRNVSGSFFPLFSARRRIP